MWTETQLLQFCTVLECNKAQSFVVYQMKQPERCSLENVIFIETLLVNTFCTYSNYRAVYVLKHTNYTY